MTMRAVVVVVVAITAVVAASLLAHSASAFAPPHRTSSSSVWVSPRSSRQASPRLRCPSSRLLASSTSSSSSSSNGNAAASSLDDVAALRAQAEKIRLEAEKMDAQLTLDKVKTLEKKLQDKAWRERHPKDEVVLKKRLQDLNEKLQKGKSSTTVVQSSAQVASDEFKSEPELLTSLRAPPTDSSAGSQKKKKKPLAGFCEEDLKIFTSVALKIEDNMPNATMKEKLQVLQTDPDVIKASADRVQEFVKKPFEEMGKLEEYKSQYLMSTSSVEKEQLKRQIDSLQASIAKGNALFASAADGEQGNVAEMSSAELQERISAIEALPELLQGLYRLRNDVDLDADLSLAILVDHHELQLESLETVRFFGSSRTEDEWQQLKTTYDSLPKAVQEYYCMKNGLEPGLDGDGVVNRVREMEEKMDDAIGELVSQGMDMFGDYEILPEYSDIEFIERSRFLEEFIPSIARMEQTRPTEKEIEAFCSDVIDKDTFILTGKPERVMGGYYIRGVNRFEGVGAGNKLVEKLNEKLEQSLSLKDDLQFFFISDPCPRTDEELLAGEEERHLLAVTCKNTSEFYCVNNPQVKAAISLGGVISAFIFALGTAGMNGDMTDRIQQILDAGSGDVSFFVGSVLMTFVSMLGVQMIHEVAHRLVAWKDKFDIGFPNLIPSLSLGITGSITPLQSPPKNWNTLFDFAVAGPLAGMAASTALLYSGLGITASMDVASQSQLPALPVILLHSSALGGGLIESFLGSGALMTSTPETAVLPLHPLAIAGYVGLISNALSLLPVGQTDGGRMWLSFLGRRGFFIFKTIATLTLCAAGLFGFDESDLLLPYALFVVIWQRELETPVLNEVDDLDLPRGVAAFAIAALVGLTLIPLPS